MIILVGGEKGGTGKTTLCTNLAALRALRARDVLILDTDKQGSASAWAATRDEVGLIQRIPCIQKFGSNVGKEIRDLQNRYEEIIVDAGGKDSVELRSCMSVADRMVIPVQASQFDVWTLGGMDLLVQQAQGFNQNLEVFLVLNRVSTHPGVQEMDDAKEIVKDLSCIRLCHSLIKDRIAFRKAARLGLSVFEVDPSDPKASSEIESLYQEVFGS